MAGSGSLSGSGSAAMAGSGSAAVIGSGSASGSGAASAATGRGGPTCSPSGAARSVSGVGSSGRASAVCFWKSCISTMPLPSLSSFLITLSITVCGLLALKSKESRSHEKIATLRVPR